MQKLSNLETLTLSIPSLGNVIPVNEFKWKHFAPTIILWCLRWYGSIPLSYANVSDMLDEHGISLYRLMIYRWFIEYAPVLRKKLKKYQFIQAVSSWQLDETYIKVNSCPPMAGAKTLS